MAPTRLVRRRNPAIGKPPDLSKLTVREISDETWEALSDEEQELVLANTEKQRQAVVDIFDNEWRWQEEWATTGDGGHGAIELLFHDNMDSLAERVLQSDPDRIEDLLEAYPNVGEDGILEALQDLNNWEMGWCAEGGYRCGHDEVSLVDGSNLDYQMEVSPSHRDAFEALRALDPDVEAKLVADKMRRANYTLRRLVDSHLYRGADTAEILRQAIRALEVPSSRGVTLWLTGPYPTGHFYADVRWASVREALEEMTPAEPEEPEFPETVSGIRYLMRPWADLTAEERERWTSRGPKFHKARWETERKWQVNQIKEAKKQKRLAVRGSSRIAMEFPDGVYIVDMTPEEMTREAQRMAHCIGNAGYLYDAREGRSKFFSLRTPEGHPVYSLEAPLRDGRVADIRQVKCHRNLRPHGQGVQGRSNMKLIHDTYENLQHVVEFIRSLGVDPSGVSDLCEAKGIHPELFAKKNPSTRRRRRRRKPTASRRCKS